MYYFVETLQYYVKLHILNITLKNKTEIPKSTNVIRLRYLFTNCYSSVLKLIKSIKIYSKPVKEGPIHKNTVHSIAKDQYKKIQCMNTRMQTDFKYFIHNQTVHIDCKQMLNKDIKYYNNDEATNERQCEMM